MRFRKFASMILLIMTMFTMHSCFGGKVSKDPDVVAQIEKEDVKREEVDEYYAGLENGFIAQYGEDYKDLNEFKDIYLDLVNQYVEQRVLVKYAQDEGIVDETKIQEKVDEEFENMKEVFGSEEEFATAIVNSRFKDEEDYKNKLKISLIIEELVQKETNNLKVSSSEIKKYYEENSDKFLKDPGADVYHIFLNDEAMAEKVLEELESGEDFGELAKIYSQDGSASVGGYLGYQEFENSQLVKEFMDEVKDMEEGEVRGPVKTQFGYHIIKVENINDEEWTEELDRVSKSIEETLKADKINDVLNSLVEKAKEKYKVKIFDENIVGKKE